MALQFVAYSLADFIARRTLSPTNAVGLATNNTILAQVRASLNAEINKKFTTGEPATIPSAAARGYRNLEEAARRQAQVEAILYEHGIVGSSLRYAVQQVAQATGASNTYVQAIAERLQEDGGIALARGAIRIIGVDIPELSADATLAVERLMHRGLSRLDELNPDVTMLKSEVRQHPLVSVHDVQGRTYALLEPTANKSDWLSRDSVEYVLDLQRKPPTQATLVTMFMGEPRFPTEYLTTPDFVPDQLHEAAGELHDAVTRRRMLIRGQQHRVSLLGERVVGAHYGRSLTGAAVAGYDSIDSTAPMKQPGSVWEAHRSVLMEGTALEILGASHNSESDITPTVEALVSLASGPDRYDAEKIRSRLHGGKLSDAALGRVMTLAGRRGLMGTSLASHYRLYSRAHGGR